MRSIRGTLSSLLIASMGLLVLTAGLTLSHNVSGWLEREFDAGLESKGLALVTLTKQQHGEVELDFADQFMPEFESESDPQYFEIWLHDGTLLERSRSFERSDEAGSRSLPRRTALSSSHRRRNVSLPDGRHGRAIQIDFVPQFGDDQEEELYGDTALDPSSFVPGEGVWAASLVVARERESLDRRLFQLRWGIGLFTVLLLATVAAITVLALGIGLRPLARLADEVERLDADTLGSQIDLGNPPSELSSVVQQINRLLLRLDEAFRRERQLTSDIAHELKTPIAELRSLCEVGERYPEDVAAGRKFFDDAWSISIEMERVVTHLLALAHYDEGRDPVRFERLALASFVESIWAGQLRSAEGCNIELRIEAEASETLEADPEMLRLVLANLLANATAYGRPQTSVIVRLEHVDGRERLSVSNLTDELEAGDVRHVFDRFWRKDTARTKGRSVGLGLSLVRAFGELMGFEVSASLSGPEFSILLSRTISPVA